eukprot:2877119-Pyramimonas_sp.AAC.1
MSRHKQQITDIIQNGHGLTVSRTSIMQRTSQIHRELTAHSPQTHQQFTANSPTTHRFIIANT